MIEKTEKIEEIKLQEKKSPISKTRIGKGINLSSRKKDSQNRFTRISPILEKKE